MLPANILFDKVPLEELQGVHGIKTSGCAEPILREIFAALVFQAIWPGRANGLHSCAVAAKEFKKREPTTEAVAKLEKALFGHLRETKCHQPMRS